MNLKKRGYMDKILYINLTDGSCKFSPLDEKAAYLLLGGKGLGLWILYKMTRAGINPLSPENLLIFATGPLTGTIAPTSSKLCIVTKSPATGTLLDSYCGGFFASELKFAGFDCIVISGRADEPSIIVIENESVDIKPAKHLWGLNTAETEAAIKGWLGKTLKLRVSVQPEKGSLQ